jgi:para-nitrobenzyl esterase
VEDFKSSLSNELRPKETIMATTPQPQGMISPSPAKGPQLVLTREPIPVNVSNFIRAETDLYLGRMVKKGSFGKLSHRRVMSAIDEQDVVRMNRDTIYSSGVFDLEASPLAVTLPDAGKRFMSMQVISQDHFTIEVDYTSGHYTYTKEKVGTRYVFILVRTLANPEDPKDMEAAHTLQDAIKTDQASMGSFETPNWDAASQDKLRAALDVLGSLGGLAASKFGNRSEVDPVAHLVASAIGWGGNPEYAAVYSMVFPKANDGKTVHAITVKDVPVDGFWSISVYNAKGFFEKTVSLDTQLII